MDFIRNWTLSLTGLLLISTVTEFLLPNSSLKKYANLTLGFLIIVTLIRPIAALNSTDILLHDFQLEFHQQPTIDDSHNLLVTTFSSRLVTDIQNRLSNKFGALEIEVEITADKNGVLSLEKATIFNAMPHHRKEIENELKEIYGFAAIEFI